MIEDIRKDIFSNLGYSNLCDSTDEFNLTRGQLSQGDLIFIYRNSEDRGVDNNLLECCIRIQNDYTNGNDPFIEGLDKYIVELYTENYSVIYPHMPRTYLDVELYEILQNSKVPQDILLTYKQIIEDLKQ